MDLKKADNNILLFCVIGIFVGLILVTLNAYLGQPPLINTILSVIGIFILIFSGTYVVLTLIIKLLQLFIKKLKDNIQSNITFKIFVSLIISIIFIILIINSINASRNYYSSKQLVPSTSQLLKTQINTPGRERCTAPVMFTIQNPQLSAEGITANTGLEPEQIIFINPQEITGFEVSNPQLLKYTLTSSKKVIMCAICSDYGKEALEQALIANGVPTTINSTIAEKTLCAVYPKKEH